MNESENRQERTNYVTILGRTAGAVATAVALFYGYHGGVQGWEEGFLNPAGNIELDHAAGTLGAAISGSTFWGMLGGAAGAFAGIVLSPITYGATRVYQAISENRDSSSKEDLTSRFDNFGDGI